MRRNGAFRESMSERSEFRFAALTRSIDVSRSADSPAAFSVPFLAGQKGDIKDHGRKMTDRSKDLTNRVLST
jgi:hypothetical protein